MVENGGGTVFPVVFFDGEREISVGNIRILPVLVFKAFQLILSQRLKISPNQFSVYLCDGVNKFENRRRIPVTGKSNFAVICHEKNCFFLVVLKRSRKSRYRKTNPNAVNFPSSSSLTENLVLLRRNLNERVQNFENVMRKSDPDLVHLDSPNSFPRIRDTLATKNLKEKKGFCYECEKMSGTVPFHHCTNDALLVGWFRTRFGPIIRPAKQ